MGWGGGWKGKGSSWTDWPEYDKGKGRGKQNETTIKVKQKSKKTFAQRVVQRGKELNKPQSGNKESREKFQKKKDDKPRELVKEPSPQEKMRSQITVMSSEDETRFSALRHWYESGFWL